MQCRQGFLALPTGRDFIPGRCLPRLSSSLWIYIAQKKKGEPWPKSFTFSSLEGHSDPPPLQVPNTINFRRTDCAALLNTPCFCGVSSNWWYSVLKKVSSNEKQIKNQIKKYRSKPDLYSEEKIRTPYINPSQIKTTGILVEFWLTKRNNPD